MIVSQFELMKIDMFHNPNVSSHIWKERCNNESDHKYKSTIKGVYLGRVSNIPVTDDFASNVRRAEVQNPMLMAHLMNSQERNIKDRFPGKRIFGTNRANRKLVLPFQSRELHNVSPK